MKSVITQKISKEKRPSVQQPQFFNTNKSYLCFIKFPEGIRPVQPDLPLFKHYPYFVQKQVLKVH